MTHRTIAGCLAVAWVVAALLWAGCGTDGERSTADALADKAEDAAQPEPDAGLVDAIAPDVGVAPAPRCIEVTPNALSFGPTLVGQLASLPLQIRSCGTAPLELTGISLSPGSSPAFALDTSSIPGFESGPVPSATKRALLDPGETVALTVTYMPDSPGPLDDSGVPFPDLAQIVIENDTTQPELVVGVKGVGMDLLCPLAVITVTEGSEVVPQTTLHLQGNASYSKSGQVIKWEWSAVQPVGSVSIFVPSNTFPEPTFEVNVAGSYGFSLKVWDEVGDGSNEGPMPRCPVANASAEEVP